MKTADHPNYVQTVAINFSDLPDWPDDAPQSDPVTAANLDKAIDTIPDPLSDVPLLDADDLVALRAAVPKGYDLEVTDMANQITYRFTNPPRS